MDRRANTRYDIWLPLQIDELVEGVAVSHDASKTGMKIVTASKPVVGSEITIGFRLPPEAETMHEVVATVVRVGANERDPEGLWPYEIAVEFDEPIPEIESLLQISDSPARSTPPSSGPNG